MPIVLPQPVSVWDVPLAPLTLEQALDEIDHLIRNGEPTQVITVNLHTVMLAHQDLRLHKTILSASLNLADGMPLIWASRWRSQSLPERVAGSDLLPALFKRSAENGYRCFLLGGGPGVGETAAARLLQQYPQLQVVGIEAPPFRPLTEEEEQALVHRIRAARPDLLFVAFGQPKGELWLARHQQALGVPVSIQVGATLDFLAGRVPRAPRWIQRVGLEWAYRLYQEPGRMFGRYARNGFFFLRMYGRDMALRLCRRPLR